MPSQEPHLNRRFKVIDRYGTGGGAASIKSTISSMDKSRLRAELRARRRLLPAWRRHLAERTLARRLMAALPRLAQARHVAFYLAADGEIDLRALMVQRLADRKDCYLPVLHRSGENRLDFVPYDGTRQMQRNRFGIPEPVGSRIETRSCRDMDIIFMPMVGFDADGRRLGMGGGFYDRTLADCHHSSRKTPLLVAVAHDIQYISRLPDEPWDIHPDMIVTPHRLIKRTK